MNEIIICVGISGSGKSTWSSNFIKENPNYLRINRDDIRKTLVGNLDGYYQRKDLLRIEELANDIEICNSASLLNDGYNLIIDNTNLKQKYIKRWLRIYPRLNFKFKLFDISLEISKSRVADRDYGWTTDILPLKYPEKFKHIDKQYKNYQNIKEWIIKNYKDKIIK